jgi:hypothetical protein
MCNGLMHKVLLILAFAGCLAACHRNQAVSSDATPTPSPTPPKTAEEEVGLAYTAAERAFAELNARNRRGAVDMLDLANTSLLSASSINGAEDARKKVEAVRFQLEKKDKQADKQGIELLGKVVAELRDLAQKAQNPK